VSISLLIETEDAPVEAVLSYMQAQFPDEPAHERASILERALRLLKFAKDFEPMSSSPNQGSVRLSLSGVDSIFAEPAHRLVAPR
jgi:hypothetical protein